MPENNNTNPFSVFESNILDTTSTPDISQMSTSSPITSLFQTTNMEPSNIDSTPATYSIADSLKSANLSAQKTLDQQSLYSNYGLSDIVTSKTAKGTLGNLLMGDYVARYDTFLPGGNNEDINAKNQSGWEVAGRALGQFTGLFGYTFFDNPLAYKDTMDAVTNLNYSELYDDQWNRDEYQNQNALRDYFAIYTPDTGAKHKGVLGGLASYMPGEVGSGAKWGNLVGNLGYTAGAVAYGMAESAVLAALIPETFGASAVVLGAETAKNLKKVKDAVALTFRGLTKADKLYDATKAAITVRDVAKKGYYGLALGRAATSEGKLEAIGAGEEFKKQQIAEFTRLNGVAPDQDFLNQLSEKQAGVEMRTFSLNMPVLMFSDAIQFGKALTGGKAAFRNANKSIIATAVAEKGVARTASQAAKLAAANSSFLEKAFSTTMKGGKFMAKGLPEGAEEFAQKIAGESSKRHYDMFSKETSNLVLDVVRTIDEENRKGEIWDEFWAGFLTGSLTNGVGVINNKIRGVDKKNEEAQQKLVTRINEANSKQNVSQISQGLENAQNRTRIGNPSKQGMGILNAAQNMSNNIVNAVVNANSVGAQQMASEMNNRKEYFDYQDDAIKSALYTNNKTGRSALGVEVFKQNIENYDKIEYATDVMFNPEATEAEISAHKEKTKKQFEESQKQFDEKFDEIQAVFPNMHSTATQPELHQSHEIALRDIAFYYQDHLNLKGRAIGVNKDLKKELDKQDIEVSDNDILLVSSHNAREQEIEKLQAKEAQHQALLRAATEEQKKGLASTALTAEEQKRLFLLLDLRENSKNAIAPTNEQKKSYQDSIDNWVEYITGTKLFNEDKHPIKQLFTDYVDLENEGAYFLTLHNMLLGSKSAFEAYKQGYAKQERVNVRESKAKEQGIETKEQAPIQYTEEQNNEFKNEVGEDIENISQEKATELLNNEEANYSEATKKILQDISDDVVYEKQPAPEEEITPEQVEEKIAEISKQEEVVNEAITKIEEEESKQELPIVEPTTQSEIEAKKAEIEKLENEKNSKINELNNSKNEEIKNLKNKSPKDETNKTYEKELYATELVNGVFQRASEKITPNSIYTLKINGDTADVYFSDTGKKYAFFDVEYFILSAFRGLNSHMQAKSSNYKVTKAKAKLENGQWKLVEKGEVVFDLGKGIDESLFSGTTVNSSKVENEYNEKIKNVEVDYNNKIQEKNNEIKELQALESKQTPLQPTEESKQESLPVEEATTPTSLSEIEIGDTIIHEGDRYIVTEKDKDGKIKARQEGTRGTYVSGLELSDISSVIKQPQLVEQRQSATEERMTKEEQQGLKKILNEFMPNVAEVSEEEYDRIMRENNVIETPFGFVYQGKVYINPRKETLETRMHEYMGHIFMAHLKENQPAVYNTIMDRYNEIPQSVKDQVSKNYPELQEESQEYKDEVLATYIGQINTEGVAKAIKQKGLKSDVARMINRIYQKLLKMLNLKDYMSIDKFNNKTLAEALTYIGNGILQGKISTNITSKDVAQMMANSTSKEALMNEKAQLASDKQVYMSKKATTPRAKKSPHKTSAKPNNFVAASKYGVVVDKVMARIVGNESTRKHKTLSYLQKNGVSEELLNQGINEAVEISYGRMKDIFKVHELSALAAKGIYIVDTTETEGYARGKVILWTSESTEDILENLKSIAGVEINTNQYTDKNGNVVVSNDFSIMKKNGVVITSSSDLAEKINQEALDKLEDGAEVQSVIEFDNEWNRAILNEILDVRRAFQRGEISEDQVTAFLKANKSRYENTMVISLKDENNNTVMFLRATEDELSSQEQNKEIVDIRKKAFEDLLYSIIDAKLETEITASLKTEEEKQIAILSINDKSKITPININKPIKTFGVQGIRNERTQVVEKQIAIPTVGEFLAKNDSYEVVAYDKESKRFVSMTKRDANGEPVLVDIKPNIDVKKNEQATIYLVSDKDKVQTRVVMSPSAIDKYTSDAMDTITMDEITTTLDIENPITNKTAKLDLQYTAPQTTETEVVNEILNEDTTTAEEETKVEEIKQEAEGKEVVEEVVGARELVDMESELGEQEDKATASTEQSEVENNKPEPTANDIAVEQEIEEYVYNIIPIYYAEAMNNPIDSLNGYRTQRSIVQMLNSIFSKKYAGTVRLKNVWQLPKKAFTKLMDLSKNLFEKAINLKSYLRDVLSLINGAKAIEENVNNYIEINGLSYPKQTYFNGQAVMIPNASVEDRYNLFYNANEKRYVQIENSSYFYSFDKSTTISEIATIIDKMNNSKNPIGNPSVVIDNYLSEAVAFEPNIVNIEEVESKEESVKVFTINKNVKDINNSCK